jgi:hypothetical protein
MEHILKTWGHEWDALASRVKTFEYRDERSHDFTVGDVLVLRKWDPRSGQCIGTRGELVEGHVTEANSKAATLRMRVTYVLHGGRFGVPAGHCVMAIVPE